MAASDGTNQSMRNQVYRVMLRNAAFVSRIMIVRYVELRLKDLVRAAKRDAFARYASPQSGTGMTAGQPT